MVAQLIQSFEECFKSETVTEAWTESRLIQAVISLNENGKYDINIEFEPFVENCGARLEVEDLQSMTLTLI